MILMRFCIDCVNLAGLHVGRPRLPLNEPDENTATFLKKLMSEYRVDLPVEASV